MRCKRREDIEERAALVSAPTGLHGGRGCGGNN